MDILGELQKEKNKRQVSESKDILGTLQRQKNESVPGKTTQSGNGYTSNKTALATERANELDKMNTPSASRLAKTQYGVGNIDLWNRPQYKMPDGSTATVRSASFYDDRNGKEVLVPTIANVNGKPTLLTDDEAWKRYEETGEYLGMFDTAEQANRYAQKLHEEQEKFYSNPVLLQAAEEMTAPENGGASVSPLEQAAQEIAATLPETRTPRTTRTYRDGTTRERQDRGVMLRGATIGMERDDTLRKAGDFAVDAADAFINGGGNQTWGGLFGLLAAADEATGNAANKVKGIFTGEEYEPFVSPFRDYANYHNEASAKAIQEAMDGHSAIGQQLIKGSAAAGNMVFGSSLASLGGYGYGMGAEFAAPAAGLGASATQSMAARVAGAAARVGNEILRNPTNVIISAGSGGQSYMNAVNQGASQDGALKNAIGAGLLEYFSNKMFGGTPLEDTGEQGYVMKLVGKVAERLGKTEGLERFFGSTIGKGIEWIIDKLGEGLEEVITEIGDPIIERLTWNPEAEDATLDEIADAFIGGVVLSLLMGGGEALIDNARTLASPADFAPASDTAEAPQASAEAAPQQNVVPQLRGEAGSRDEGMAGGVTTENGTRAANYTSTQTTAQSANIGAIERVANTLGRAGQRQMVESYDGQSNAEAYARGFITMYNVGKASVTGETIVRNTENAQAVLTLNPAQRQIARAAGAADAQNAVASSTGAGYNTNIETEGMNNGRAVSVRDGGERYARQDSGEQVRVVAESAGRNQAGQASAGYAESARAGGSYAGQTVSSAQLGIAGGDTSDTVTVYNGENTREVKKAKKLAAERGVKLELFAGGDIHQGNVAARGAYDASTGTVYARVDDADYTVDQIVRHELGHDMFAKGELDLDAIREQVKQAAPNGNVDALAEKYVSAYEGASLTAEEAWEECVCDALGGMNEFGRVFESEAGNYADAQQQLRSAARETQGARAPPSRSGTKFSIHKLPDGRLYVEVDVDQGLFDGLTVSEMQKTARNVISERFKGKVIGADYTVYVDRGSARHYAYPANRRMNVQQKSDKMRASTELDNIVAASVYRGNVPDDGRHPSATGGLDKLDTIFKVGGRMYSAEITVLVTGRGRVFYDLTKFRDITGREAGQTQSAAETSNDASTESISNASQNSNTQNQKNADVATFADAITPAEADQSGLKFSRKDSEGRELTEAQAEYFKDSKARNANGNLMVVYHGGFATNENGDGNVFAGRGPGYAYNPNSIFLTDDLNVAQAFGGRQGRLYELYVDVKNPVVLDAQGRNYTDIPIADDAPESLKDYFLMTETADADNLSVYAQEYGYDGVIIRNVREGVGGGAMTEIIALSPEQVKNVTNKTPTSHPDIRFSRKYSDAERQEHANTVADYFGTTRNWNEVGYVTQDGRMVDFSGRHDGATGGYRTVDHRDVTDALGVDYGGDGYSDAMVQFMSEGNIRIMPETGGINIQVEPTDQQYDALTRFIQRNHGEVIVDIDNETGDTVESVEYDRGTHSSKIIADIKSYYQNGAMPQQSEVAKFHTMFSRKLGEERIFRTPQGVEVVQNPTDSEYAQMRSEVYRAYPWLRETGEPPLRRTFDEEGNVYYWSSADAIHARVEPYINREYDTRTSQHWKWWEKPDKDDYPIQYSRRLSELDALREQNEDLRERVDELKAASREAAKQAARADYWQGQTKRTTAPTVREGDIKRVAKDILKGYDSALNADDIAADLKAVGDYLVQTDELTYEDLKERAAKVARQVVENATVLVNSETMDIYRDVKSTLGQEMTISAQDAHWIPDWGDWRKRNRSKVNVRINGGANARGVDVAYSALSEDYPWLFPAEITNPSDQLLQMVDALDSLAPVYQNPHSFDMAQAVEYCTNDIIDALLSERVRQTAPTFADKQAAKLDEANARTARVRAEERQRAAERVARVRDEKNAEIEQVREEGRERVDRLREQKNRRIEEIKRQGREKMREAVEREAERRKRQVDAIKEHYQTQKFEQAERRADSAARTKLLNLVRRMQRMKTNGANRALLNELIGDIDGVSKSITGKSVQNLSELRDWYLEQKENDPDFISDPHVEKALERLHKRHVADMSLQEVMELTDVLRNIENELRTERKLIDSEDKRDTYMQGVESISNIENSRGSKGGTIDALVTTELLTPTREMRRVTGYVDDDPLYRLTRDLEAGQRKMFDYTRKASERFRKWVDDKKLAKRIAGKNAEEIKVQGISKDGVTEVTITPAMRMSLYLHSKNDQNLRHIAGGGITVPDIKLYKKGKLTEAYARGTTIKLEPSQVRSIVAHMTAEEKAFADAASAYFNGTSRDAINEVSEKLKGYSLADVENYFPINTDSNFTKKEMDTIKFDGTIEGMGFLKERVNAANPIMLRDMNAVLTQAIDQHARYVGLAIPVRNFNKVYGVTKASFNEDGSRNGFESSVQQAIQKKWGSGASKYIEKLMSDLQSPRNTTDAWGQRLAKLRSNYAGATLELNASVAVKQSASYPTAAAVVGWSPLIKALADPRKVDIDTVAKYTPLLWYRSQGFSSQELGDIAKSGKGLPKALNWIQGMDVATTTELWQAAEYYVRAHNKSLTRGSGAYYEAVAEVYNRIIEETQPNYTTMQRPQLLRSDNEFVKALNMFKTQPFQNYNILYDALGNLRAKRTAYRNTGSAESKAALREAQTGAARAISSQVVSAFVFALMQYAWDAFRGKDDKYKGDEGEQTLLSWFKGIGLNMVGSGFGMLPFGSEMLELGENLTDKILQSFGLDPFFEQKWYGFDEAVTGALTDASNSSLSALVQTVTTLQKALDGEEELTEGDIESYVRQLVKAAGDVGSLSGAPLNNVKNLFTAAAQQIFRRTDGEYVGGYKALRLTSDPAKYASDYYDLLYDAYKNDQSAYKEVYQLMLDSERFTAEKVASAIEQRMKKDAGVESVSDLAQRYLNPKQQATYDKSLKAVQGSTVWRNANAAQKDAALDMLYDLATGNSDGKKITEKVASGKQYGIDETKYILYRVALAVADAQNSDTSKRNGSYDQDEATRAAQMMNGVSGDGLGWLWASTNSGWKDKNNPYK